MPKIHKKYINEALRIRKDYLQNLKSIGEKELIVSKHKEQIQKIMNNVSEYMEIKNMDQKLFNDELLNIEKNINSINSELEPFKIKLEQLQKDSKLLYHSIKEKYPEMSEGEIQKEILDNLTE